MTIKDSQNNRQRFSIFRAKDTAESLGVPTMVREPSGPIASVGGGLLVDAGISSGHHTQLLFSGAGFSLVYAWFKANYPLPRHSHNVDCLYYIQGGSIRVGQEELGVGDGFFVAADVPYHYVAGPNGVEILEFRAAEQFNINVMAENERFWAKALQTVKDNQAQWASEQRPSATPNK